MKTFIKLTPLAAAVFCMANATAAYPEAPIKLVVPFAAGGPSDVVARSLADALSRTLDNPVIVENKPGAGGAIGSSQVARAAPDGYTLGVAAVSTHVVNPACNTTIAYDPIKDFTPISLVAEMPMIWVMQPAMKEPDLAALVSAFKDKPGAFTQGTAGMCTLQHMLVQKINAQLGISIESVPYQGSAPAMTDFMGGNIDLLMDVSYLVQPLVASGKAKPIAVVSTARLEALPNVPTVDELGHKELNIRPWYGVVAPAGLPDDITQKLTAAVNTAMADPKLQNNFKGSGMVPVTTVNGQDFSNKIKQEFEDNKPFAAKTNADR